MSTLGIIAIACVAFVFGALVGVILISMCFSNERYDTGEACYDYGYESGYAKAKQDLSKNMDDLCSHCGKAKGFDELNEVDR